MKRTGFTLIELLIVMAIIAALMAVLIPTATGAMRKATATRIAVQLRNLQQGVEQYILATLPKETAIPTGGKNLEDDGDFEASGFVDQTFLGRAKSQNGLKIQLSRVDSIPKKITMKIEFDTNNQPIALLVKGSLVETYGEAQSENEDGVRLVGSKVIIRRTIEAFWW